MNKKRILILSLGVGAILGRDQNKMTPDEKLAKLTRNEFSYRTATYSMAGRPDSDPTEFIAEPLIKSFQPDEIFIIGTSKSAWTGFYGKFGDGNQAVIKELFEMEELDGIGIRGEELKKRAEKVEKYYRSGITRGIFGQARIHVIMLCYGVDDDELAENYRLLRSIEDAFDRKESYEIAFDITHSFRSLPLYNLVVLNYLKSVSQIDLEISHVYYGNVEITGENSGKAPIIDLKELTQMLNLLGGINEFKNTGNCASLLQHIPDTEKELKEALEKFDWATQLNVFDQVKAALGELIVLTDNGGGRQDKFTDLRNMISDVIQTKFFGRGGADRISADNFNSMPLKECQYLLCRWYLNQNRYGQAVVTALEAMRSYLTEMYLPFKGIKVNNRSIMTENYRKESVDRLKNVCRMLGEVCNPEDKDTAELLRELEQARAEAVDIRNKFAHNLVDGGDNEGDVYYGQKKAIGGFIEKLGEFRRILSDCPGKIEEIYQRKYQTKKTRGERIGTPSRLVIAYPSVEVPYRNYRSTNKKTYMVYRMPERILAYLEKMSNSGKSDRARASWFLSEYVADLEFEPGNLQVVFHDLPLKCIMNYAAALQNKRIECRYSGIQEQDERTPSVPALAFDPNREGENWEMNSSEQDLMALDIQKQI